MAGNCVRAVCILLLVVSVCSAPGPGLLERAPRRAGAGLTPLVRRAATPSYVTLADRTNCAEGDTQPPNRVNTTNRVANLLTELKSSNYSAYIITTGDEHQSEYPPDPDRRRAYISGFSGSAGTAVVLANGSRALWTDGRYFLQADDELDCQWLLMKDGQDGVPSLLEWLQDSLGAGDVASADAKLIDYSTWTGLSKGLSVKGAQLDPSPQNLVDVVWSADLTNPRPEYGHDPAIVHDVAYAGVEVSVKLDYVRGNVTSRGADVLVVTALDEVAWLYNIRGRDVLYNPVLLSYAIVSASDAFLYVDQAKITTEVQDHLTASSVTVKNYTEIWTDLAALSSDPKVSKIFLPDNSLSSGCSYEIYNTVSEDKRLLDTPPVLLLKAEKNPVELKRMREAVIRDGVALVDFLAFLESQITSGIEWTEVQAQDLLATYRATQTDFMDLSFETISGYGPHGAIIHYESTNITDVPIGTDSLYLLDSGGQYLGATTDVTRTMHYGTPTAEMVDMYTRVLMGTIDFAALVFPKGTRKTRMDILARRALFAKGLNYRHGTSHGIGMYLNVHEATQDEFHLGYVSSDEPGFYKDGEWGIRIENQVVVVETEFEFDVPFYTFETMTLVPFEPKLIDVDLLTDDQIVWLNAYNAEIREKVGAELQAQGLLEGYQWLLTKTEPLAKSSLLTTDSATTDGAAALLQSPVTALLLLAAALLLV